MEKICITLHGEEAYATQVKANRERVLQLAMEPAQARPPAELLIKEHAMAEAAYQKQKAEYDQTQARARWLRRFMRLTPIAETLCALLLVALASGWERWATCVLITVGWWMHKMEHYIPNELKALDQMPYPQRHEVIAAEPLPVLNAGHHIRNAPRHIRQARIMHRHQPGGHHIRVPSMENTLEPIGIHGEYI